LEICRLVPHASAPPLLAKGASLVITLLGGGRYQLTYTVEGAGRLVLPRMTSCERADNLWQETCFELFLRRHDGPEYYEFNFSPSRRWAAYGFSGYREDMSEYPIKVAPQIEGKLHGDHYTLRVELSGLPQGMTVAGISAVLGEEGQVTSYWALNHPGPRPDFHHPASFIAPFTTEHP
jgi:hypothetical protein